MMITYITENYPLDIYRNVKNRDHFAKTLPDQLPNYLLIVIDFLQSH